MITTPPEFIGQDSDGDGIDDNVEDYGLKPNGEPIGSNKYLKYTDGDGIDDNVELIFDVNYLTPDVSKGEYDNSIYMGTDPTKKDTDGDGLDDNLDDYPLNNNVHSFLLYETSNTDEYLLSCKNNDEGPEDYRYSDKSKDELRSMKWINWTDFTQTKSIIKTYVKIIANDFSMGDMDNVVEDMFDHFFSGAGGTYSNDVLTNEARNHEDSNRYIHETTEIINKWIRNHNGDISALKYDANNRNSSVMVSNMKNNIAPPTYEDKFGGLGICVDGTYGNQFEITSYKCDGINYEYTIKYTIYDIFGLDTEDISNPDRLIQFGTLQMFRSWYILQHWDKYDGNYKPFITYIEFEETISGKL